MARSKQIAAEVAAALAKGTPHPEATVADWKKLIKYIQDSARRTTDPQARQLLQEELHAAYDGLRAASKATAAKPTFVTETNLGALKEMVVKYHGNDFPGRVYAVDAPHLKRCIAGGLAEIVGGNVRLTREGRDRVADSIIKDIERASNWMPTENKFVAQADQRAKLLERDIAEHDRKVQQLEDTLAKLRR